MSATLSWHYRADNDPLQVCTVAGASVNVLRIPERWVQPRSKHRTAAPLDYWLNSHQLMHIFVTIAMFSLYLGASADYHFSTGHSGCPEPSRDWQTS